MFISKKIGELFKFLGKFVIVFIGVWILAYAFMFVLDIYPQNCNYIKGLLHEKCLNKQVSEIDFNNRLNGENPYTTYFIVTVPEYTPDLDQIYLETSAGTFEMNNNGENVWTFNITRPGELKYRYNRNGFGFLTAEKFEPDSEKTFRSVNFTYDTKKQNDEVLKWRYLSGRTLNDVPSEYSTANLVKRDFMKGVALGTYWKSSFNKTVSDSYNQIKNDNAEWVMITSANSYAVVEPLPVLKEINSGNLDSLKYLINEAKKKGLKIMLKIRICCNNPAPSKRSSEWWDIWFNETEKVVSYYTKIANENNIDAILIDYTYGEAIAGARYPYRESINKWENILVKMHSVYNGKIGFNNFIHGSYNEGLIPWPDGVKSLSTELDFYGVEMWTALGNRSDLNQDEMNNGAERTIESILRSVRSRNKPVVITGTVYTSVDSCAESDVKISSTTAGLLPWEAADGLKFDSVEQAMVYEALLKAVADQEMIQGFFSYGYNHIELPDSLDYSIRGKEAEQVLKKWYSRL